MESKDDTFPLDIVFGLALFSRRFLFLLACFEAFVGKVHLDGSTIKRFVQVGHAVMTAIDAPSSPQFLFDQYVLRFLPELCLERWCETLEFWVVVWSRSWQGQSLE